MNLKSFKPFYSPTKDTEISLLLTIFLETKNWIYKDVIVAKMMLQKTLTYNFVSNGEIEIKLMFWICT